MRVYNPRNLTNIDPYQKLAAGIIHMALMDLKSQHRAERESALEFIATDHCLWWLSAMAPESDALELREKMLKQ